MTYHRGSSEHDFRHRLLTDYKTSSCFPLDDTEFVTDGLEHPAYAALVIPSGPDSNQNGTIVYTAPATQWIAIAREVLRTFAPTTQDHILAALKELADSEPSLVDEDGDGHRGR